MSFARNYPPQRGISHEDCWPSSNRYNFHSQNRSRNWINNHVRNHNNQHDLPGNYREHVNHSNLSQPSGPPSFKRRKFSASTWEDTGKQYLLPSLYEIPVPSNWNGGVHSPTRSNAEASTSTSCKFDCSKVEDDEPVFLSRDEIERYSPSRKDGIDALRETYLRYSYCGFIQNLGLRLELPQTTIGTAMVICHRFFVRRSHACHDRFLIATAALFLAAKSEETPRPLNNMLRASAEILHKQDISFLSYLLPVDWFEQYRERVIEAETMILTTLNFELNVQHPYAPLTSVLYKLGLAQSVLVNLALNLVSEGIFTRIACSPV
ncbi:cyclin-T1-3-like isoform X2 [Carica papaya]|uniref:cyclin-T1-3-like isoform X2 n=1 Tax=Carica papaya TaxID=3649 RepID=UPI000B8CC38B|nr:cyclin-T1-3-like isoform X2 [Carica papaya]